MCEKNLLLSKKTKIVDIFFIESQIKRFQTPKQQQHQATLVLYQLQVSSNLFINLKPKDILIILRIPAFKQVATVVMK